MHFQIQSYESLKLMIYAAAFVSVFYTELFSVIIILESDGFGLVEESVVVVSVMQANLLIPRSRELGLQVFCVELWAEL